MSACGDGFHQFIAVHAIQQNVYPYNNRNINVGGWHCNDAQELLTHAVDSISFKSIVAFTFKAYPSHQYRRHSHGSCLCPVHTHQCLHVCKDGFHWVITILAIKLLTHTLMTRYPLIRCGIRSESWKGQTHAELWYPVLCVQENIGKFKHFAWQFLALVSLVPPSFITKVILTITVKNNVNLRSMDHLHSHKGMETSITVAGAVLLTFIGSTSMVQSFVTTTNTKSHYHICCKHSQSPQK